MSKLKTQTRNLTSAQLELLAQLEQNVEFNDDPQDPEQLCAKARALVQIADIKDDDVEYSAALQCLNDAIGYRGTNPMYFAERSKLHVKMGNMGLAVLDMGKVKELPQSANFIFNRYTQSTIEEVGKLKAAQDTIDKLSRAGRLDKELADSLRLMNQVTASHSVKLFAHEQRLDEKDIQIRMLNEKVQELTARLDTAPPPVTQQDIAHAMQTLREDINALRAQVAHLTQRMDLIEQQVSSLDKTFHLDHEAQEAIKQDLTRLHIIDRDTQKQITNIMNKFYNPNLLAVLSRESDRAVMDEQERAIMDDPYQAAFYKTIRTQLNAVYVASEVISTGLVDVCSTATLAGKGALVASNASTVATIATAVSHKVAAVGQVIEVVGKHIPLLGSAVQLLGKLLAASNTAAVEVHCQHYLALAESASDMDAKVAKPVSHTLTRNHMTLDKTELHNSESFFTKVGNAVNKLRHAVLAPQEIQRYFNEMFEGHEHTADEDLKISGIKDATLVADILICKIYEGDPVISTSRALIQYVLDTYQLPVDTAQRHTDAADDDHSTIVGEDEHIAHSKFHAQTGAVETLGMTGIEIYGAPLA